MGGSWVQDCSVLVVEHRASIWKATGLMLVQNKQTCMTVSSMVSHSMIMIMIMSIIIIREGYIQQ